MGSCKKRVFAVFNKKSIYIYLAVAVVCAGLSLFQPINTYATDCKNITAIFAPGSGESAGNDSDTYNRYEKNIIKLTSPIDVSTTVYRLGSAYQQSRVDGVRYNYPAIPVGIDSIEKATNSAGAFVSLGLANKYGWSVREGVKELKTYIDNTLDDCPDTKIILGGYSQGAQVIDTYLLTKGGLTSKANRAIAYYGSLGDPKLYLPEGLPASLLPWDIPACRNDDHKWLSAYREYAPECRTSYGFLRKYIPTVGMQHDYVPNSFIYRSGLWCELNDFLCGSTTLLTASGHSQYAKNGHVDDLVKLALTQAASELTEPLRSSLLYSIRVDGNVPPPVILSQAPTYPTVPKKPVEKKVYYEPPKNNCLRKDVIDLTGYYEDEYIYEKLMGFSHNYNLHKVSDFNNCEYALDILIFNRSNHFLPEHYNVVKPTRDIRSISAQINKFYNKNLENIKNKQSKYYYLTPALHDLTYNLLTDPVWDNYSDTDYNKINIIPNSNAYKIFWIEPEFEKHTMIDILKLTVKKKIKVAPYSNYCGSEWGQPYPYSELNYLYSQYPAPIDEEEVQHATQRKIECKSFYEIYNINPYPEPAELSPIPKPLVAPRLPVISNNDAIKTVSQKYIAEPGQEITVRIKPKNPTVFMSEYTNFSWDWDNDGITDEITNYGTASHTYNKSFEGSITVRANNVNNRLQQPVSVTAAVTIKKFAPEAPIPEAQNVVYENADNNSIVVSWDQPNTPPHEWIISANGIHIAATPSNQTDITLADVVANEEYVITVSGLTAEGNIGAPVLATEKQIITHPVEDIVNQSKDTEPVVDSKITNQINKDFTKEKGASITTATQIPTSSPLASPLFQNIYFALPSPEPATTPQEKNQNTKNQNNAIIKTKPTKNSAKIEKKSYTNLSLREAILFAVALSFIIILLLKRRKKENNN